MCGGSWHGTCPFIRRSTANVRQFQKILRTGKKRKHTVIVGIATLNRLPEETSASKTEAGKGLSKGLKDACGYRIELGGRVE
jgi:hypothetical protein